MHCHDSILFVGFWLVIRLEQTEQTIRSGGNNEKKKDNVPASNQKIDKPHGISEIETFDLANESFSAAELYAIAVGFNDDE